MMSPAQRPVNGADGPGPRKRRRHDQGGQTSSTSPSDAVAGAEGDDSDEAAGRQKRAPIACRLCRARKVKCSNERPTCAGCVRLGRECVYPELPRYTQDSPEYMSPQVTQILQEILKRLPATAPSSGVDYEAITPQVSPGQPAGIEQPVTYDTSGRSFHTQRCPSPTAGDSVVGVSPAFTSLDHMFQWPLFRVGEGPGFVPGNILAADHLQPPPQGASASAAVPLLDGEEITTLLTRFLRVVHVMNPVLDCTTLMTYGRSVAELGPQWDAKTCLVLLAAALGAIARPLSPGPESPSSLASSASHQEDTQARKKAESYYQFAKRRFGLLGRSLTACQCHFLSGTYLLYTLRPVEAWQSFFQASSMYTVYLKSRAAAQLVGNGHCFEDEVVGDDHCSDEELRCCLEQRLFWSCIKAESEICAEIELPRSGLHNIDYPYQFPSPPTPKSVDGLNDNDHAAEPSGYSSGTATSSPTGIMETQDFKELHEHSWFYYLSEISLLRLSSRVHHAFYVDPPSSWARMNLLNMINTTQDFETQLQQWQNSLPKAICCFDTRHDPSAVTRLQLATWSRSATIKLHLYRPFLYRFALGQEQDLLLKDALRQLAEKAVLLSLNPLFSLELRHRHAGTWFKCRETAARALIIVCARRIGLVESMGCGERARDMLELCLAHLRYWEAEAADVRLARSVLEAMC